MTFSALEQLAKTDTEHAHQRAFFAWLNAARLGGFAFACGLEDGTKINVNAPKLPDLDLFHAIPNGGARDKATAAKLKAEGVKAGVLDTFLPVSAPNRDFGVKNVYIWHGLYIEFKEPGRRNHKNGGLSDEQLSFGAKVAEQGYCVRAAYTWKEAANHVMAYYGVDIRIDTK